MNFSEVESHLFLISFGSVKEVRSFCIKTAKSAFAEDIHSSLWEATAS